MAMMLSSLAAPALLAPVAPIARAPAAASAKMALVDSMCAAASSAAPLRRCRAGQTALAHCSAASPPRGELRRQGLKPLSLCRLLRREGVGEETGGQIWDPLGISEAVSDEAVMWFRASELKHGRVAMVRPRTPLPLHQGDAADCAARLPAARAAQGRA